MPAKLIMSWDIRPETDSEYFEFLVHEFIPGLNKLGIIEIQVWYTQFGDCEQKLASGITQSVEDMKSAMQSDEWDGLIEKLDSYVNNFNKKVINATGGFQV
jgi:3-dehydroquinate dehydratase